MEPNQASQWTLLIDVRQAQWGPKEIMGQYDNEAIRQMKQMKREVEEQKFFKGQKAMMDMAVGHVVMM